MDAPSTSQFAITLGNPDDEIDDAISMNEIDDETDDETDDEIDHDIDGTIDRARDEISVEKTIDRARNRLTSLRRDTQRSATVKRSRFAKSTLASSNARSAKRIASRRGFRAVSRPRVKRRRETSVLQR